VSKSIIGLSYKWFEKMGKNSVPEKDFDRYMDAHLAFADSLVSGVDQIEARAAIQKWERYAG